jgi:hypothetical protein
MDPNQSFSFQNNDKIQLNRYLPDDVPGGKTYLDIMESDPNNI